MSEQENIDLHKLSQKELLIVTYRKVEDLSAAFDKVREKQETQEVRIAVVETRSGMFSAIFGATAGAFIAGIFSFFK